ncbi:hypothetical protein AGABI1DRAFT_116054 [Agaricus bisporus var. burnettii JB137-S8]|uniref:AMP-dependent synthetase/ligase domain-containing protein n=1 Tax=Agaricus bisporus var. burnettii (strain JB137-S8 / ATCC MYA-4627 / FGSC 10392) TaxID=597362 RepID=K5WYQ0_AGABU|nr:uncharacterized protein AGABI1DRAFT_116054 [Agaricus bisporus var. burnettii JB137-S8]EKM75963.1 hypothetical protein AGABI1DRAFT_116054 [Agaricus bisporus var. burnettii JB137-S8]
MVKRSLKAPPTLSVYSQRPYSHWLREMRLPPLEECPSISEALDFHREHNPQEPLYVFSVDSATAEPTSVSFEQFGRACDRVAQFVRPGRLGNESDGTVVALLLVTDVLLYQAMLIGIMKSGYVPFPMSQRLTPQAIIHLLTKASCHHLMVTSAMLPTNLLDRIKQELEIHHPNYELHVSEMPSPSDIYPEHWGITSSSMSYPVPSQRSSPDSVALYFHSSGSTGLPKVVPHTNRVTCSWAALTLPQVEDFQVPSHRRYATMALLPAHVLAYLGNTIFGIYYGFTMGLYPPTGSSLSASPMVSTPDNFLEHAKRTRCSGIIAPPIFMKAWARSESDIKELAKFRHIIFAGGPLSTEVGDALVAAGVNLQSMYGASEFGIPTKLLPQRGREKDWEWIEFCDSDSHNFIDQNNGTYEYNFMPNGLHQPSVINRPDGKGYASSDLFIKHPTNNKLWKIIGRLDDMVILSNGVNIVSGPIEAIMLNSPSIDGAVVFGRGYDRAGILIEPRSYEQFESPETAQEFRDLTWALVERANSVAPLYYRILNEMILFTSQDKPLPRTLKGTVMRKLALKLYEEEIDSVYREISLSDNNYRTALECWEAPGLENGP